MNTDPFPPAAVATFTAGLDDYQLTTPTDEQTPRGAAERAVEYLISSGWAVHIPARNRTGTRIACPCCPDPQLINHDGRIRRHGPADQPCNGSGTPAIREPAR